jgi:hypothetical protein
MDCDEQVKNPSMRVYDPIPKHEVGGFGTPMDLSKQEAEEVLQAALCDVKRGKGRGLSLWGCKNGRIYRFMCDGGNPGKWHGYPTDEKPPTSVLRQWRDMGTISKADYNRMVKLIGRGS